MHVMHVEWLGRMDFEACWSLQEQRLEAVLENSFEGERIYLVEHPHILTLGKKADRRNILGRIGPGGETIPVIPINRGGDVTYHGPGQLIGYPILDLTRRGRDIHRYLRQLEAILMRSVARFGVDSFRRPGLTGVWTDSGKLASIGLGVRHWVTQHGFALNVCPDLSYFELIHPCGLQDCPVVSLSSLLDREVSLKDVIPVIQEEIEFEFWPERKEPAMDSASDLGVAK